MSMLTQPDRRLLFKRPVDPIEERLSRLFPEPVLFEANERLTDPALFPSGPMYRFRMADDPQRAAIDRAAELAALRNRHAAEADDPGRDLEPDFDPDFDAAAFLAQRFADLPESVQANAAAGKYDSARNLQHLAEMVMADAQAAQLESQMLPDERREAAALARSGQPVQLPADPELRQAAIDALNAVRGPGGDGDAADGIDADREAAEAVGAILQAVEGGETPAEDVRRVAQAAVRDGVDQDFAASMIGREPRLLMGTVADVQRQRFYEAMRSGATLEELAQLPLSDDESEAITGVLDPTPILDEIERHSRTRAAANEPANVRIREARDRLVAAMGEEAAQPSAERGAAAEAGVRLQRGLAAVRRTAFSSLIMPIAKLQRVMTGQPWDAGIEAALLEEAAGLHERLAELPPTQYENIIAQGIFAGIESAPQFATQIAAGALPGGALMRVAAFTSTGVAPVFGQTVQQAYAETGDLDRATEEAAIAATITAATNVVPGYAIVGRSAQRAIATSVLNRGLVGAASRAVAGGGAEAVQEMTEQIGQEVLAYYYRGKEIDWRQIPVAGIAGLFLGGAGRAAIEIRFRRAIADAEARQAFERSIEGKTPFERMRLTYAFVAEQAGVTTAEAMFDRETLLSRLGEQGISEEAFAGMTTEQQVAALERAAREIANEELGRIEVSREAAAQAAQEGDQGAEVVQPVSEADVAVAGAADVPGVPSAQPAGVPEAPEGGTAAAPSAGAEGVERGTPPPAEGKQGENKGKLEGKQGEVEPTRTNLDRLKELRAQGMSLDEAKAALKQEQSPEGQMARLVSELGLSPTEARRRIERPDEPPDAFAERANARGLAEGAYAFAPGLPAVARPVRSGNGWAVAEGLDGFPEGRENGESLSWAEAVAEADRRNLEVNGLPADTDMTALVDLARATTATKGASDAQGVRSDEGEVRQKARGDDVRRQGQEQAGTQPAGQVAQPPAEAVPAGQVSPVRAAFAALGPGHAKVAAALDALVAEGTMRPASADVVMLSLQGADDAYLEALDIGSAAAIRWMPKPRRAADPKKPFEPWEMTQAEFKDQYFQHNILSEDAGEVGPEGFRSGIGPNVVAVTTGQPENIIAQRYGTKAGRDIYLVPKSAVRDTPNGPKIKEGWVPTKADRFTPSRDYQPVHEMVVERALSEGKPVPIEAIADHLALLEKAGRNRVGTMLVLNKSRVRILIQRHLAQKAPEAGAADIQDASVLLEEYFHAAEQLLLSPQERAFLEAEYAKRDAKQWAEYFRDGIAGGDKEAAAYAASNFSEWFAHLGVEHALGRRLPVTPEAQSIIARLVKALRDAIKRLADRGYMRLEIIRIMDRMLAGQPSPVSTQEATDATQTQPDEDQADSGQPARPEDQPSPAASTGRKRIVKAQLERIADIEEIAKVGGEDMLTQMHAMIRNNSDDPDFSGIEEFGITPDRAKTYTPAERMRITNAGIAINHNYKVIEDRFGSDAVDKIMDAIIGGVEGQRRAIYDSMMREPGPWGGHQILSAFILSRWSMWADVERKTGRGKPKMRQEGEKIQRRKNPSSEPREMLDPSKLAVGNSFQLFGENFYVVEDAGALFLEGDAIRVSMPLADFVGTGTLIPADIGTFEEFLDDDAAPFGRHLFDPSEEPVAAGPTFSLFMPPKASETIKAIDRSSMSNAEKADVKSRIEENATDEAVIDQIIEDSSEAPPEPIQLSPEQVLRARGIEVTKKTIPGGRTVHSVSGNTYAIKDTLKKLGGSWYAKDKTWTFWSGDPTSAIAAALSERGVGPDKSKPSAGRGGAEDLAIKAARDRELNRADERPTGDVAVGAVQLSTADLIRLGSKAGIPDSVLNSQIEDVGLIRTAFEAGKPMFLIGSAPGSGKTFVIAGAIRELRDAGAERFMWVTMNQTLIEQIRGDVSAYGLAGVEFATYADLSANKEGLDTTNTVLILDEAHNVKNETLRGATASKMIRGAKFTLFSSATPFENPVQAKYLEPTGLFDAVGGHTQWAILFGAHTREIKGPRGEKIVIPYWRPSKESAELAKGARRWFEKQGVLSQRPLTLPPDMVYAAFERYSASDEFVAMYDSVQKAYDDAERVWRDPDGNPIDPKTASLIAMHRTNATKRILEAAKTQEVIRRVRELRAAGRKVVVFVETKADREIGRFRRSKDTKGTRYAYPQITEIMAEWQMERDMARASGDTYPPRPFSEAIVTIAHSMYNHGLSDTSLPSVTDEIVQAIPDAFVFTGELSDAKGRENLAAWRETKDGVLLATMAKGGTGLSLHDKIGDFPTAMVVLNMPWSATQLEQVSGRINRYGLASRSENYFAFAENIPFEAQLARRIGGRLRAMNATVKGLGSVAADALEDFDFESGFGAETMLLAEEQEKAQGGRETEREIDAFTQAEALDKTRRQSPDKEMDFFATPYVLSAMMAKILAPRGRVLEPSVGEGNLLKFLPAGTQVDAIEPHVTRIKTARGVAEAADIDATFHNTTFGSFEAPEGGYDGIIMNPPFSRLKGEGWQDITHVRRAFDMLSENGRLVAVMSEGPFFREDAQSTEFREWLDDLDATIIRLPEGAFSDSGTGVRARVVVIDKQGGGAGVMTLDSLNADDVRALSADVPIRPETKQFFGRDLPGQLNLAGDQVGSMTGRQGSLFAPSAAPPVVPQGTTSLSFGLTATDLQTAAAFSDGAPTPAFAYGVKQYLGGFEQAHRTRDMSDAEYREAVNGYAAARAGASPMQRQGAEFLAGQAGRGDTETGMLFGRAFHGSPYTFDRFSTEKIGTGEGAQAYGYGLYFAGKKEVAEWYRRSLTYRSDDNPFLGWRLDGKPIDPESNEAYILRSALRFAKPTSSDASKPQTRDLDEAIASLRRHADFVKKAYGEDYGSHLMYESAANTLERYKSRLTWIEPGRVYEVELAPQEDEYLLWDRPLSEQSEKVQKALLGWRATLESEEFSSLPGPVRRAMERFFESDTDGRGEAVYRRMSAQAGSDRAASQRLHSLGIRGIKYLEGSSRSQIGAGRWNVVVKDENGTRFNFWSSREAADKYASEQRELGHDVEVHEPVGDYNYVIFSDADVQITQMFGRALESVNQDELGFYSRVEDFIAAKVQGPQPGATLLKSMQNAGLSPDEMKWTGIEEWLQGKGDAKVSPDELREWMAQNRVRLVEVVKGTVDGNQRLAAAVRDYDQTVLRLTAALAVSLKTSEGDDALDPYVQDFEDGADPSNRTPFEQTRFFDEYEVNKDEDKAVRLWYEELMRSAKEREQARNAARGTEAQFQQFTLPGGENYREVLLTLPANQTWTIRNRNTSGTVGDFKTREEAEAFIARRADSDNWEPISTDAGGNFRSPHFPEPNIIAHVRITDRETPDGKRVLFLEEVQSDWHQAGRELGYKPTGIEPGVRVRYRSGMQYNTVEVVEKANEDDFGPNQWVVGDIGSLQRRHIVETSRLELVDEGRQVPPAPFSKTWHEMAFRRALRLAAEGGYDALGWTTGEQQAERYDLGQTIERIIVDVRPNVREVQMQTTAGIPSSIDLAVANDGTIISSSLTEFMSRHLSEVVGSDLSTQILSVNDHTAIDPAGLQVGASGMREFYDRILPSYAKKIGKKWGAKPETVKIDFVGDRGRDAGLGNLAPDVRVEGGEYVRRSPVHTLPITEQMRESVVQQGQPLFGRALPTDTPEFKAWFGESKVVNPDGSPMVLYHGSARDLSEFKTRSDAIGVSDAYFFSDNPNVAADRAMFQARALQRIEMPERGPEMMAQRTAPLQPTGANVIPVYVRMVNPRVVHVTSDEFSVPNVENRIIAETKAEGKHDGVLFWTEFDNGPGEKKTTTSVYAAFDPTQIKSTFNVGTFDPRNPDIRFGRSLDPFAAPPQGPPARPALGEEPPPPERPRIKINPDDYRVARRHEITPQTAVGRRTQAPLIRTQMAVGRVVESFIDHRPIPSTTLAFSPNAAITAVANILDHIGILRGVSTGGVYSGSRAVTEMAYLRQWNARAQEIRDRLDANITAAIGERAATRGILETLGWQGMRQSARRVRQYTGIPWQRLKRAERETKQLERRRAELMRIDPDNRSPRQQAELDELPFKIDQQRALAASLAEQFDRELTISLPEGMTGDEVRKGVEAAFAAFSQEAEQLAKRELAQSEAAPLIRRYLGDAADYAVVSLNADYIEGTAGLDRIMRMIYGVTEEQAAVNAPFKPGQWVMAMDRRNYGQVVQINVGEQSAQVRWINKRKGTSAQRWMPWGELMPARADESRPLAPGPGGAVEMKDSAYWRQGGVDRPPLNPDDPRDMQEIVRQINADRIAFKVDPDTPFVNEVLTDPAIRFDDLETRSYIAGQRRRAIDDFFLDTAKRELGLWDTPIDTWEALLRTIELAGEEAGLEPSKAPDPKQRDRENARQQAISAAGIQTLRNMIDFILERQQTAAQDHAVVGAIIGGVVEGVKNYTVARSLRTAWLSVGTESARLVARHVSRAGFRNTILDFTRALYGQLREMTPIGRRRYRDFWDGFLSTAGVSHTTRARELAGFDPVTRRRLQREDDMRATMTLTGWMLGGLPLALTREAASLITTGRFAGGRRRVPALRHFTLEEGSLAERRASLAMTNAHFMRMLPWLAQIDRMLIDGSAKTPGEAIRSLRPPVHIDAHDYVEVKARISSPHLARLAERQARREGIGRILGMDYFEGHAPETMAYKGYLDFVGRYINSATPTPTTKPITMQEDRGAAMLARFLLMFRSWAMADATQAGRMALTQSQGRNFAVFTAQLGASLAIKFARTMLYFGFGALAWQKWEELWDDEEIVQTLTDIIAYANLWGPSEAIMQPIITAFASEDWRREQLARGNIHPAAGAIEDASRAALYTVPKVWKADDDLTPADVRRLRRVMILPEAFPFMLWRTDFERSDLDGSESSNRKARALLQRR